MALPRQAPLEEFLAYCAAWGQSKFDLRRLPPQMRLEFQYALQRRVQANATQTRPEQIEELVRALAAGGVTSMLDRPVQAWLDDLTAAGYHRTVARAFLADAVSNLRDLLEGTGWDAEYPRDVWQLHRLGYPTRRATLNFADLSVSWLRELAKRWVRWRLTIGLAVPTVRADLNSLIQFAADSPELHAGPQALTREVLERHLARMQRAVGTGKTRSGRISRLGYFLSMVARLGWEPRIPGTAAIYGWDYPRTDVPAPRALSEYVMAQLENPDNLARFPDVRGRLLVQVLMRTGLRVSDGAALTLDCLLHDPQGAPYLRYRNHKMAREAFVPIDDALAEAIADRQARVHAQFPTSAVLFPAQNRNPTGRLAITRSTFVGQLHAWLLASDVRDELGRPAAVTPHQWRHTYGTRLINADVSQEVVRRLLDHSSHEMTARYARMTDRTIRDSWERARKVNVRGQDIPYDPTSPLADAVWMKENLGRARMALPNGYCGLPLQQTCPHANACLTCPLFLTTADFLPEHRRQLEATHQLIADGETRGQLRLVEMNRTVASNLTSIIDGLEQPQGCCGAAGGTSTTTGCACQGTGTDHAS